MFAMLQNMDMKTHELVSFGVDNMIYMRLQESAPGHGLHVGNESPLEYVKLRFVPWDSVSLISMPSSCAYLNNFDYVKYKSCNF